MGIQKVVGGGTPTTRAKKKCLLKGVTNANQQHPRFRFAQTRTI
jgi:hypothetical protein